ncbi:MAG: heme biosynthesis HemY N-terminal domain-containing protein [Thiohalomonadales bacterium]
MIKLLFFFLAVLLLSVLIGLFANHDTGYVLIGRGYYTVELSLTLFVVLQLVGFVSLYAIVRVFIKTWHMPKSISRWNQRHHRQKAHEASNTGLVQLAQGQWKKAEHTLIKNAKHSDTPLVNYLSAARAAQKMNAPDRRDEYLELAQAQATKNKKSAHSNDEFAIQLTQAELQMAHGQLDKSFTLLKKLLKRAPHHSQVLFLLFQLYSRKKDNDSMLNMLPEVRKLKLIPVDELSQIELELYTYALNNIKTESGNKIIKFWKTIPKNCQENDKLIELYALLLIKNHKQDVAHTLLQKRLKESWKEDIMLLFGDVESSTPVAQLEFAEKFLKQHEKNHSLLLSLGKLSKRCELWGKARSYLEASIGIKPQRETYRELGELLEQLGEENKAAACFKDGLFLDHKINSDQQPKLIRKKETG